MYINFLAKSGWDYKSICKNRKLHKFATTNSNFEKKKKIFRHASS